MEILQVDKKAFFDPEKVLKFLEFLNTKFSNLKLLKLILEDNSYHLFCDENENEFNMPPVSFKNYTNYKREQVVYDGRIKVELNHKIMCSMVSDSKKAADYFAEVKKELFDFDHSCSVVGCEWQHNFKRTDNISENFTLYSEVYIYYRSDNSCADSSFRRGNACVQYKNY